MKVSVETITHRLIALLTAAVFVFMTMGTQLALAYGGQNSSCGLERSALNADIETDKQGMSERFGAPLLGYHDAYKNFDHNQSEPSKAPCCSTYCSPMFSLLAPAIQTLPTENDAVWELVEISLSGTLLGRLKRPPRAISDPTARA